jgi:tetratricopeptide (TPR) repeat protein
VLAEVLHEHAVALTAQSKLDAATAALRESLTLLRDDADIRSRNMSQIALANFRLGQLLFTLGLETECVACFQAVQSDDSEIHTTSATIGDEIVPHALLDITCPVTRLRSPPRGIKLTASLSHSQDARHWQLLALAQYRSGDWAGARSSLLEAIRRRPYVDPFDSLLVAMTYQQLGDPIEARQWYDKAMANYEGPVTFYTFGFPFELEYLRRETEALLSVTDGS